jgi:hypothetical protein
VSLVDKVPEVHGTISFKIPIRVLFKAPRPNMQAFVEQARPLYGQFMAPAGVVDITISRDGIPHDMRLKEKAPRILGVQAVGSDLHAEMGGARSSLSGKSYEYSVNRSWKCTVPFIFSASGQSYRIDEVAVFCVEKRSTIIGDMRTTKVKFSEIWSLQVPYKAACTFTITQYGVPGSMLLFGGSSSVQMTGSSISPARMHVAEEFGFLRGTIAYGTNIEWVLVPAYQPPSMQAAIAGGGVMGLRIYGIAEFWGVGVCRGIQYGVCSVEGLSSMVEGRLVPSQLNFCNIVDTKSSISGVGYEFISFG